MKTKSKFITAIALAGFAIGANAQNAPNSTSTTANPSKPASATATSPATTQPSSTATASQTGSAREEASLADTSALLNKKITDKQGGELGQLERLLFDPTTGRVRYGVVEVNKAWNLNDPEVVIPWGAFQVKKQSATEYQIQLDSTRDKLEKAQKFDPNNLDQLASRQTSQPIYAYWAVIWIDEGPVTPASNASTAKDTGSSSGTSTATPGSTAQPATAGDKSSTTSTPNPSADPKAKQTGAQQ